MTFDWEKHKRHRQKVIADHGQWVGLLDENGIPLWDMPPIIEMSAPETRHEPSDLTMTVRLQSAEGYPHPATMNLVASNLTTTTEGELDLVLDPQHLIVVERAGEGREARRAYMLVSPDPSGGVDCPETADMKGVDVLDWLGGFPCPSRPESWTGRWITSDRDWAGPWEQERDISDVRFSSEATGHTVSGPAEQAIRQVIQRSLDAAFRTAGVLNDPPIVLDPATSGLPSPPVLILPNDDYIWPTISPWLVATGVRVRAPLWLPGDTWGPTNLTKPTGEVYVLQTTEVV